MLSPQNPKSNMNKFTRKFNFCFNSYSEASKDELSPYMEYIFLPAERTIYRINQEVSYVYFPTSAIFSLFRTLEDGNCTEVSTVGNEGVVGATVCLGDTTAIDGAIVQRSGYSYRLLSKHFILGFNSFSSVRYLTLRYLRFLLINISQIAACNRHHTIKQQLCRWLLLSTDRHPDNQLFSTHEFIADMLGTRRESISLAAKELRERGGIIYNRGNVVVKNQHIIENISCECYPIIKNEYSSLINYLSSLVKTNVAVPCAEW